jgi:hypothetical protein
MTEQMLAVRQQPAQFSGVSYVIFMFFNLEYDHECIRRAIEHAITKAHSTSSHHPSATILSR